MKVLGSRFSGPGVVLLRLVRYSLRVSSLRIHVSCIGMNDTNVECLDICTYGVVVNMNDINASARCVRRFAEIDYGDDCSKVLTSQTLNSDPSTINYHAKIQNPSRSKHPELVTQNAKSAANLKTLTKGVLAKTQNPNQ